MSLVNGIKKCNIAILDLDAALVMNDKNKLDRSIQFGVVYGESVASYEQNGNLYDANEIMIKSENTKKTKNEADNSDKRMPHSS